MEPARADERITISQKTGYIQIKKRSASVDQHPIGAALAPAAPVKEIRPPVPLAVPAPAVVAAVPIGGTVPVLIGPNGRRLSQNGANDQRRTSTPPRKILPKSDAPEKGAVAAAQVTAAAAVSSHLPLGVMGASRLSQPVSMKPNAGSPQVLGLAESFLIFLLTDDFILYGLIAHLLIIQRITKLLLSNSRRR